MISNRRKRKLIEANVLFNNIDKEDYDTKTTEMRNEKREMRQKNVRQI